MLNADDFYAPVLQHPRNGMRAGVLNRETLRGLVVEARPGALIDRLLAEVTAHRR